MANQEARMAEKKAGMAEQACEAASRPAGMAQRDADAAGQLAGMTGSSAAAAVPAAAPVQPSRRRFLAGTGAAALAGALALPGRARAGAGDAAAGDRAARGEAGGAAASELAAARGAFAASGAVQGSAVHDAAARAALDVSERQVAHIARLLPGCCAYSYDQYLRPGLMTMEDFIRMAVKLKVTAVDMTGYYFRSTHPAYLASLRHLAYKNGVAFSGAACGVRMVQARAAERRAALAQIRHWIDVTDQLGAPHLRVFAGRLPAGATEREAIGWVVETMRAACDYAGARGIMVGIEDHSGITQRADVCLELMHRIGSPWAGINLDITHFLPAAGDRYRQIAECVPYATNTHIRDEFDDKEPIEMDRVWEIFVRGGFKGYTSVEYEKDLAHNEDPITGVPKLVALVRKLCARYSSV